MITYEKLLSADPARWHAAGRAWHQVGDLVTARAAEVAGTATRLRRRWSGSAGTAAGEALATLRGDLIGSRPAFIEVDQVLAEYAAALAAAKASAVAAADSAPAGVVVGPQGSVSVQLPGPPGAGDEAAVRRAAARRITTAIQAALALAADADGEAAQRLTALAVDAGGAWTAQPPPDRPAPGAEPATVRRWWEGLDPAQRRWLVLHEARLVGRLDGVPADARDQANRLLLEEERAALVERRAQLLARWPRTLPVVRGLAAARRTLAGIDTIRERLTADTGPRAYLLAFDPSGDGRAVVAVGNPDRADNVLTYVPGMTSDLPRIAGELDRTYAIAQRCAELGPTERTASVLWLDYDAPDFLHEAAWVHQAHAAGPGLHRFQEGLRATHEGLPAHQAVLGHSYGSLVVGATVRDYGLAADRLVFLGSPGVGVDHVSQLGVPASRVWSSTAYDDVIQYAALSPQAAVDRLARFGLSPVAALPLLVGLPSHDLWFGRNPSDPSFGGQIFGGASHGHIGYWDPGNPALDCIARVTLTGQAT